MAEDIKEKTIKSGQDAEAVAQTTAKPARQPREIKGNLPYLSSPNYIKRVLEAAINAERPDNFSKNWINTVLNISGGATGSVPNFLKKLGFVGSDGTPTERYSRFKTESGRGLAIFEGLKQAYSEIFAKNEVAHRADEAKVVDYIVEITGLTKTDPVVRHMYNSFDAVRQFLPHDFSGSNAVMKSVRETDEELQDGALGTDQTALPNQQSNLGLSYHINIVLPETDNQMVLDAIFKSIKRNLL